MIAAEDGANNTHIETLANLSRLLLKPNFIDSLKAAKDADEVLALVEAGEAEVNEAKKEEANAVVDQEKPLVIAVTACPTGIAHTYMAEDALKEQAKKMGVNIRVETNGSDGAKNVLTKEEIEKAVGVIVAADKNVEMDRFDGKHLLKTPVSEAIRNPKGLINKSLNKEGNIFKASGEAKSQDDKKEKTSIGGKIYKDVMNGVSHMLPFVVGGGILIAVSFMAESSFGENSQIYKFLMDIGGNGAFMAAVMAGGMVPPLAIALATVVFKHKFTEKERESGMTNWLLGATFITEGAIPFAAADPVRVIVSSVIGSAIAGGLTQLWHVNAPAPHGGVLVAFVMNPHHVLFFFLSIIIGTVISGMIYGIWKKTA